MKDKMAIRLAKAPSAYGRLPSVASTEASCGRDQADLERRSKYLSSQASVFDLLLRHHEAGLLNLVNQDRVI